NPTVPPSPPDTHPRPVEPPGTLRPGPPGSMVQEESPGPHRALGGLQEGLHPGRDWHTPGGTGASAQPRSCLRASLRSLVALRARSSAADFSRWRVLRESWRAFRLARRPATRFSRAWVYPCSLMTSERFQRPYEAAAREATRRAPIRYLVAGFTG